MPPPIILAGRDFYDDSYYEDDHSIKGVYDSCKDGSDGADGSDTADENNLAERLDFSGLRFQGRSAELQVLHDAYRWVVRGTSEDGLDGVVGPQDIPFTNVDGRQGTQEGATEADAADTTDTADQHKVQLATLQSTDTAPFQISATRNCNGANARRLQHGQQWDQSSQGRVVEYNVRPTGGSSNKVTSNVGEQRQGPTIVVVSGYSGTGKSALVRHFQLQLETQRTQAAALVTEDNNGPSSTSPSPIFISGKFDQLQDADPFAAISEAFTGLVDSILARHHNHLETDNTITASGTAANASSASTTTNQSEWKSLADSIHKAIGNDWNVLSNLIPNIAKLISATASTVTAASSDSTVEPMPLRSGSSSALPFEDLKRHSTVSNSNSMRNESTKISSTSDLQDSKENAWNRLQYVFCNFVQSISTPLRPIILHLNDVQWASRPSLDLISALLNQKSITSLLFLASVRVDDINPENSDFYQMLESIRQNDQKTTQDSRTMPANRLHQPSASPPMGDCNAASTISTSAGTNLLQSPPSSRVICIDLLNLSFEETGDLVADLLSLTNAECIGLTKAIYSKTRGNTFFTLQALEELERAGVLFYSRIMFQWDWTIKCADALEAKLSNNVLDAVVARIERAPIKLQWILRLAAYTRNAIDIDTLGHLFTELWNEDQVNSVNSDTQPQIKLESHDELIKLLDLAVLERFMINTVGSRIYKFAHDKIQQAAYSLVPIGSKRDRFRLRIGRQLYKLSTTSMHGIAENMEGDEEEDAGSKALDDEPGEIDRMVDKDWYIFIAADHLNSCFQQVLEEDPRVLLDVNLRVGEKASAVAAFETASNYLARCLQLADRMFDQSWVGQDYELLLRLYGAASDVELWRGNYEEGYSLCQIILNNAKCLDDRLPTDLSVALSLGRQDRHRESQIVYLKCLREMKLYPKGMYPLSLSRLYLSSKRFFRKHSDYDILLLPQIKDKRIKTAMDFYMGGAYQSFYCGDMIECLMCTLQSIRVMCQHGVTSQTCLALAFYAMFLSQIKDQDNAIRAAELSKQMATLTKAKHLESYIMFSMAHFIHAWKDSHADILEMYQRGSRAGFETGDFENGILNKVARLHHAYCAGQSLEATEEGYHRAIEEMRYYGINNSCLTMSTEQLRIIHHLRGRNEGNHPEEHGSSGSGSSNTSLSLENGSHDDGRSVGAVEAIDWDALGDFGSDAEFDKTETHRLLYGYTSRLETAVYFRNLRFGETFLTRLKAVTKHDTAYVTTSLRLFMSGLVYSGLARETGKKRYRKRAMKLSRTLMTMSGARGSNGYHRHSILEADIQAKPGSPSIRTERADREYKKGIQQAIQSGHIQDAALGSELGGEYFVSVGEGVLATQYFSQARDFYEQWGASGKVDHLNATKSQYL